MCGIAGFYAPDSFFSREDLVVMTTALAHRGPDAEGYFQEQSCGLGHRRLSIIDVTEKANQPMMSQDDRYSIIYNGETYNYKELIPHLDEKSRSKLRTTSDTEIILELFAQQGNQFVKQLNGMFAMAIYDRETKELHLFRDRMGIKPLYYYWDGTNFAFASELKSLLRLNKIKKNISAESIGAFLHLGYIPAPATAYQFMFKLENAGMLRISAAGLHKELFSKLTDALSNTVIDDERFAANELDRLIQRAVELQMRSDVPLGIFLSGGIDSSLVASVAASKSHRQLKTFSIGFRESSHDESEFAGQVAGHLKTDHHQFIVSYQDAVSHVEEILTMFDEPFADSSSLPTMLLSKMTRQHVKVALSGDGADELFHGYGFYQWAMRLDHPVVKAMRIPISWVLGRMPDRYQRAASLFSYNNALHLKSHIFSQEQGLFSEPEIKRLLTTDFYLSAGYGLIDRVNSELLNEWMATPGFNRQFSPAEKQSFFDLNHYLPEDLLAKVDRASMHHSLEVRVPYLDPGIVEFSMNLSPALKTKNGVQKYILKKILAKYLPENLFNRPKQGFSIPLVSWLANELNYLVKEHLSEDRVKAAGVTDYTVVKNYIAEFNKGRYHYGSRIWALIVLHAWIRNNSSS